jgi:tRNA 2-thiouridine synthesizing protein E
VPDLWRKAWQRPGSRIIFPTIKGAIGGRKHGEVPMNLYGMLNERGFLKDPSKWNEEVPRQIARREGLKDLDSTHWEIVRYLRRHYEEYDYVPTLRRACKISSDWRVSCLSCFFRSDPMKAGKIAGIPESGGDLKTYNHGLCKCDRPQNGGCFSFGTQIAILSGIGSLWRKGPAPM